MRRRGVPPGAADRPTLRVLGGPRWGVGRGVADSDGVIRAVFGTAGTGDPGSRGEPMAAMVLACGSGRNGEFRWRIMEREDLIDGVQVAFAAHRAEAVVDALLGEVGVEVGNVGRFGIGQAEQLPAAD